MAIKVGNSWVTEAAYAKAKANIVAENEKKDTMLSKLKDKFSGINIKVGTAPYNGKGLNNMSIAPNILREMENNPEKRLEYEALMYDCESLVGSMANRTLPNGSKMVSFGFVLNSDGTLGSWSIGKSGGSDIKSYIGSVPAREKDTLIDRMMKVFEKKSSEKIPAIKNNGMDIRV